MLPTSFYWADGKPAERNTASAVFTPEGVSAAIFDVTQAGDFDFTATEVQRPVPMSTAPAEPDISGLQPVERLGPPLWLIVIAGMLIVGLGVRVTVLGARLSKVPPTG